MEEGRCCLNLEAGAPLSKLFIPPTQRSLWREQLGGSQARSSCLKVAHYFDDYVQVEIGALAQTT